MHDRNIRKDDKKKKKPAAKAGNPAAMRMPVPQPEIVKKEKKVKEE